MEEFIMRDATEQEVDPDEIGTWVIANPTGEIVRTFNGPASQVSANTPAGHVAVRDDASAGVTDWSARRIDMDQTAPALVDYQPPAPTSDPLLEWEWDANSRRWRSMPSLEGLKAAAWANVKTQRAADVVAMNDGVVFDTSPAGIANIISIAFALLADPTIESVNFTCADNTRRAFARDEFLSTALRMVAKVQAVYDAADTIRQQIDAATDAPALQNISDTIEQMRHKPRAG